VEPVIFNRIRARETYDIEQDAEEGEESLLAFTVGEILALCDIKHHTFVPGPDSIVASLVCRSFSRPEIIGLLQMRQQSFMTAGSGLQEVFH